MSNTRSEHPWGYHSSRIPPRRVVRRYHIWIRGHLFDGSSRSPPNLASCHAAYIIIKGRTRFESLEDSGVVIQNVRTFIE